MLNFLAKIHDYKAIPVHNINPVKLTKPKITVPLYFSQIITSVTGRNLLRSK